MSAQLFVDNELIELDADSRIGITRQVNHLGELQNRQADHTNKFTVPKTVSNMKALENSDRPDSNTNKPYRKLNTRYIQDGIELISNGFTIIDNSNEFYNLIVYSGNADFFDLIDGLNMSDLDLSAFNHTYDLNTVVASRLNDSGFIYSIIDYNNDGSFMNNTIRQVDVRTIFANMYVHTLVQAIVDQTPYTLSGNIIGLDKYTRRLFPFNLDNLEYDDATIQANRFRARLKKDQVFIIPVQNVAPLGQNVVSINDDNSPGFYDNPNTFDITTGRWTVLFSGKYSFTANTIISLTASSSYSITIVRERTGFADVVLFNNLIATGSGIVKQVRETISPTADLQKGDRVRLEIGVITGTAATLTIHEDTIFSNLMSKDIIFGGEIFMSQMMPSGISQKDFLKDVFNQFAIIPVTSGAKQTIEFRQFKEISQNKSKAKSIDDIIDTSKPPNVRYKFGDYAQKNIMKYKDNEHVQATKYGEGSFLIADETLPKEKVVVQSLFSASDDVLRLIDLKVCRIPKLVVGAMVEKTGFRMVMLSREDITPGLRYFDPIGATETTVTTKIPLTYFIDDNKLDSMGFDRYLISKEYNELVLMLDKTKVIDAEFYLKTIDVQDFDHFIPWHSKRWGNYFYVNIIENFQKGKLTKVELIRI